MISASTVCGSAAEAMRVLQQIVDGGDQASVVVCETGEPVSPEELAEMVLNGT